MLFCYQCDPLFVVYLPSGSLFWVRSLRSIWESNTSRFHLGCWISKWVTGVFLWNGVPSQGSWSLGHMPFMVLICFLVTCHTHMYLHLFVLMIGQLLCNNFVCMAIKIFWLDLTWIDHYGPSIDSGHYTASINCCKKTFYCNDHKITEFGITDKNSSTAYIVLYKLNGLTHDFWTRNRRVELRSLPWRWHILSIPLTTGRGTSAETCGLDDVFPPDDLGSRPEALCKYICIYIYVLSLYELCYRSYIQQDCHSVLAKLHPITFYRGVRGSWSECYFVFSLVYQLCLGLW